MLVGDDACPGQVPTSLRAAERRGRRGHAARGARFRPRGPRPRGDIRAPARARLRARGRDRAPERGPGGGDEAGTGRPSARACCARETCSDSVPTALSSASKRRRAGEEMLKAPPWERAGGPRLAPRPRRVHLRAISPPMRGLLVVGLLLALAVAGWSSLRARRLRLEVERLRETVGQIERDRERFAARVAQGESQGGGDREALALAARGAPPAGAVALHPAPRGRQRRIEGPSHGAPGHARSARGPRGRARRGRARGARVRAGGVHDPGHLPFQDADGRPLRLRLDENGAPSSDADGNPCWVPRVPAPCARSNTWGPASSWTGGASS